MQCGAVLRCGAVLWWTLAQGDVVSRGVCPNTDTKYLYSPVARIVLRCCGAIKRIIGIKVILIVLIDPFYLLIHMWHILIRDFNVSMCVIYIMINIECQTNHALTVNSEK